MKPLLVFAFIICLCSAAGYCAAWEFSAGLGWIIAALLFIEPVFRK